MARSPRFKALRQLVALSVVLVGPLRCIGCINVPDTIPPDPVTSSGGSPSVGGMAGTLNTAGTSNAGATNVAGAAALGPAGLDPSTIPCDYATLIQMDCAHQGCHAPAPTPAAMLDLTVDSGLVQRVKDVPARHLSINCAPPDEPIVECTSVPAACPTDAVLVNSDNWEASWMIAKLRGTAVGCGDIMRDPTYLIDRHDRELCVEAVVKAIAELPR